MTFTLVMSGVVSCKKDSESTTPLQQHEIISVSGPTTGTVNQAVTLTVTYPYSNGCDYISSFQETKTGNTIVIKAMAQPVPKDAFCTQDAGMRTIEYKFTSGTAGTFELKFLKLDGTSVIHTVTIQ